MTRPEIAPAFGAVLRELRAAARMTQEELALEAGLNKNYIGLLELGQRSPSVRTMVVLARGLKLPLSEFAVRLEQRLTSADH